MLGAALLGAVAGAVAGVLMAPKAGKETRKDIANTAERIKNDISDRLGRTANITKDTYHEVVDAVMRKYQEAKEISKDEAQDLRNELSQRYEETKQEVQEETPKSRERSTRR